MKSLVRNTFILVGCVALGLALYGVWYLWHELENQKEYISAFKNALPDSMVIAAPDKATTDQSVDLVRDAEAHVMTRWSELQPKVRNTVVQVWSHSIEFNWLEPYKAPQQGTSVGSGFFISEDGLLITNFHVVSQALSVGIQVPAMGKQRLSVDVVGIAPDRDLALLKLKPAALEQLRKVVGEIPYLRFGDSDVVRRSDEIMTLGYPLGQQSLKSTTGVVSGRERIDGHYMIQISAPINPGNSGGPSINQFAQVVGVNTAGFHASAAQNVNYIIPSNEVRLFLRQLEESKKSNPKEGVILLRKPLLGVFSNPGNESMTRFLGNPDDGGLCVSALYKGGPLDKAGVRARDMIYEIDGYKLDVFGEMYVPWSEDKVSIMDYVGRLMPNDTVKLLVYRNGKPLNIKFKLDQLKLPAIRPILPMYERVDFELCGGYVFMELAANHLPLLIQIAPELARYTDYRNQLEPVVVITHILADSVAHHARCLTPGAVIKEINGISIATLADLRKALKKSSQSNHFMLRTTDEAFCVLSWSEILEDEQRLAKTYFYTITPTMREILDRAGPIKSGINQDHEA